MRTWAIVFLLFLDIGGFKNIAEINARTIKAAEAYKKGNYDAAVMNYEFLVNKVGDSDPLLLLNLAHAYRKNNQLEKAQKTYEQCVKSKDANLRSVAWEQLGTLQTKIPDYQKALTFYKRALIANSLNEQARYNYEMLKKYLHENPDQQNRIPPPAPEEKQKQEEKKPQPKEEKKPQEQQQKPDKNGNQEKENPDQPEKGNQENKPEKETNPESKNEQKQEKPGENGKEKPQNQGNEKGNQEGENLAENEEKPAPKEPNKKGGNEGATAKDQRMQTQYENLRKANISPEKAEMMLNAMRNAEQQYLQQLPKKATQRKDRSKPDW